MGWKVIVFVVGILAALPAAAQTVLTVSGEGQVVSEPDMAVISLRVSRDAKTAQGAVRDMAEAARAVLAALEAQGLQARDVQTGQLQLNPRWERHNNGAVARVIGYEAATGLDVRVRDLERFGEILDAVIAQGANGFQGFRFALEAPRPAQDTARRAAFADAMAKAALYAEAAGLKVGAIQSIREGGGGGRPVPMMAARMEMDAGVPLAGGELTTQATVTLEIVLE